MKHARLLIMIAALFALPLSVWAQDEAEEATPTETSTEAPEALGEPVSDPEPAPEAESPKPSQTEKAMVTGFLSFLLTPYLTYFLKKKAPDLLRDKGAHVNLTLTSVIHVAAWGISTGFDTSQLWPWLAALAASGMGTSGAVLVGQKQTAAGLSKIKPLR